MMDKFVITIGRQLGSGGKDIGTLLAEQLGIAYYDKELIRIASKESGLGKEFFEQADEKTRFSFFGNYYGFRSGFIGDGSKNYLSNETLFKIQSDVIKKLAENESCIFVGRCADYILRDHPRLVSVFITADLPDRIERISAANTITEKEVRSLIEQTDKKRAGYYNYYTNKTWGMATSYDLCINSSLLGIEQTALYVREFIDRKFS